MVGVASQDEEEGINVVLSSTQLRWHADDSGRCSRTCCACDATLHRKIVATWG
jgi:hypothetical protein